MAEKQKTQSEKKANTAKEKRNGSIVVRDELRGILQEAYLRAGLLYQNRTGSLPSLEEWGQILALGFEGAEAQLADELDGFKIAECKLRKKRASKQAEWKPGDVVAIPLLDKKIFGYGMIVRGSKPTEPVYLEYYSIFSKKRWTISEFKKKEKTVLWTACTEWSPILNGQWKKIGTVSFDEENYQLPDFYGYDETFFGNSKLYYISKGIANDRSARVYGVSKEEAEAVRNPDGIQTSARMEEWLYEAFLKTQIS